MLITIKTIRNLTTVLSLHIPTIILFIFYPNNSNFPIFRRYTCTRKKRWSDRFGWSTCHCESHPLRNEYAQYAQCTAPVVNWYAIEKRPALHSFLKNAYGRPGEEPPNLSPKTYYFSQISEQQDLNNLISQDVLDRLNEGVETSEKYKPKITMQPGYDVSRGKVEQPTVHETNLYETVHGMFVARGHAFDPKEFATVLSESHLFSRLPSKRGSQECAKIADVPHLINAVEGHEDGPNSRTPGWGCYFVSTTLSHEVANVFSKGEHPSREEYLKGVKRFKIISLSITPLGLIHSKQYTRWYEDGTEEKTPKLFGYTLHKEEEVLAVNEIDSKDVVAFAVAYFDNGPNMGAETWKIFVKKPFLHSKEPKIFMSTYEVAAPAESIQNVKARGVESDLNTLLAHFFCEESDLLFAKSEN